MTEEEEIEEEESVEKGSGEPELPPKAPEFSPSATISTDTASTGGTCMGPPYRCDDSGRWMEEQECKNRRNGHEIKNGSSVLWQRQMQRRRRKWKLVQIVRN